LNFVDAFREELQFEECVQPAEFASAQRLAELVKFQFQHWVLSLIDARPLEEGEGVKRAVATLLGEVNDRKQASGILPG